MQLPTRTLAALLALGIGLPLASGAQPKSRSQTRSAYQPRSVYQPESLSAEAERGPLAVLVRNADTAEGAPPYALLDQYGRVQRYVEPTPGVNLSEHVGSRVRIQHDTGETLLASQLELPSRLAPLRENSPLESTTSTQSATRDRSNPGAIAPARFEAPRRATRLANRRLAQLTDDDSFSPDFRDDRPPLQEFLNESNEDRPTLADESLDAPQKSVDWSNTDDPAAPIVLEDVLAEDADNELPVLNEASAPEVIPAPARSEARSESVYPLDETESLAPAGGSCPTCGSKQACPRCGRRAGLFGECCLGEPWTLQQQLAPNSPIQFGGWTQIGYHSENTRLSVTDNDALAFNDHPDRLNLHQSWLWFEKQANPTAYGADWGFRADIMYGTDAVKTQAFGNPSGEWDFRNGWDRGAGYGWAMPQLYGEIAWDDWSVIAGHFYTLVGYEVVTAPDNFFYSHALTMFNSEPFTHSGVLATYSGFENIELYGGWTAGWDTGFDSSNGGSNFLGGFNTALMEDIDFTYITTIGNLGARSAGEQGYSHSLLFDVTLTGDLKYILQSDLVGIDSANGAVHANDQVGVNQYLIYTINDCWGIGARLEWWKSDGFSYNEATVGLNYRPFANLVIRPEVRFDWTPSDAAAANVGFADAGSYEETTFGVDAVLTY